MKRIKVTNVLVTGKLLCTWTSGHSPLEWDLTWCIIYLEYRTFNGPVTSMQWHSVLNLLNEIILLRSQDKGFHVDGALTHIFTRSLPHTMPEKLKMEKTFGKETVCFELPAELSTYLNRWVVACCLLNNCENKGTFTWQWCSKNWKAFLGVFRIQTTMLSKQSPL